MTPAQRDALRTLCGLPGRIVFPVDHKKRPWKDARPNNPKWSWPNEGFEEDELATFASHGIKLATCPASLGLWVVDVDEGGRDGLDAVTDALGAPIATVETRRGFHAYYPLPDEGTVRNQKWRRGTGAGELRGHKGYAVLWDIEATAAAAAVADFMPGVSPYPALVEERTTEVERVTTGSALPPTERFVSAVEHLVEHRYGEAGPDYHDWILIGQAIYQETGGHEEGFALWDRWSARFGNYPGPGEQTTASKWNSFTVRPDGVGGGTVYQLAEASGWAEDFTEDFDALDDEPNTAASEAETQPIGRLRTNKRASTLKAILDSMRIDVRNNVRSDLVELDTAWHGGWSEATDGLVSRIREEIAETFFYHKVKPGETPDMAKADQLEFSITQMGEHLDALAEVNKVDPFQLWIESAEWDRQERIDTFIEDVWQLADETDIDLVRWASRFIFLGAVWRTYVPGCELDEMPILVGPGGIGKSKALKWMFPERTQWFTDRFDFLDNEQKQTEKLMSVVIAENSEMAGIRRADIRHLKAAVTSTGATTRLSYRKNARHYPRRCIIVGTGDNEDILPNDPNLRRWVPVILKGGSGAATKRYLDQHREQLWAEALHRFRAGEIARLPDALVDQQRDITASYRGRNEAVEDLVDRLPATDAESGAALQDLLEACGLGLHLQREFSVALRERGWRKGRATLDGTRRKRWFSPQDWISVTPSSSVNADDFDTLDDIL